MAYHHHAINVFESSFMAEACRFIPASKIATSLPAIANLLQIRV